MGWQPCGDCCGAACCCGTDADEWIVDFGSAFLVDADCNACDLIAGEFTCPYDTDLIFGGSGPPTECQFIFTDLEWCPTSPNPAVLLIIVKITPTPFTSNCSIEVTILLRTPVPSPMAEGATYSLTGISPSDCGDVHTLNYVSSFRSGTLCTGSWPATITARIA